MKISIEKVTDNLFMFAARVDETCVGKLYLSVSGCTAKLTDVVVTLHEIRPYRLLPFIKRTVSYRGQGYGTKLLQSAIEWCRLNGIENITGDIAGDQAMLARWYRRHGFTLALDRSISLSLD